MTRIIFQDIKTNINKKKVLVDEGPAISLPKNVQKTKNKRKYFLFNKTAKPKQRIQRTPQLKGGKKFLSRSMFVVIGVLVFLGGIYWFGILLSKVDIILTPKEQVIKFNNKNFIASKDKENKGTEFEIMIISDKKFKNITLTEPKEVSINARGSIYLYNELSTTPQKILKGTFLADEDGKTYQTETEVIIPGYQINEDKKIIPGKVEVLINSFLPGESYNGSPSDFYITSFKGTNKYNLIYGKLKDELVGGAVGLYYVLDDTDKIKVENIAQTSLKDDLLNQVEILLPSGYVLYPNATSFTYSNSDNLVSKTPEAQIEIEGFLTVVLLKKESLFNYIIKSSLSDISKDEVSEIRMINLENLSFDFVDKNQIITKDINSIPFNLTGDLHLIWEPSLEVLKTKLLGIHKSEVLSVLRQDKGIDSATIKVFPPWQKYLPDKLSKINIIIKK